LASYTVSGVAVASVKATGLRVVQDALLNAPALPPANQYVADPDRNADQLVLYG
jgi:hypothetical protein